LNRINGLFVDPASAAEFTRRYHGWIGDQTPYRAVVRQKKLLILEVSLASELHVLAYQLERIALRDRRSRDFTQSGLQHVLRQVIASFPVYRSYITAKHVSEQDRVLVDRAVRLAMLRNPMTSRAIFRFFRDVLLDQVERPEGLPADEPEPADFAGKFQQVTAPVMAKGLEDTCFHNYNRLVSLNEVGGASGEYRPLPARGKHESSLFGFLRRDGSRTAVVAVPRLTTRLDTTDRFPLGPAAWQDTELEPAGVPDGTKLRNVFTGASVTTSSGSEATIIKARDVFADFPVAPLLSG